jgi:Na+/H+ antiporter NhaC
MGEVKMRHRSTLKKFALVFIMILLISAAVSAQTGNGGYKVELPEVILKGVGLPVTVTAPGMPDTRVTLQVGEQTYQGTTDESGSVTIEEVVFPTLDSRLELLVNGNQVSFTTRDFTDTGHTVPAIPSWLSIIPPIVAIGLALLTKRIIPSLLAGIWVGAWFAAELTIPGIWYGLLDVIDRWILRALVPKDGGTGHMSIMLFTILIAGMVGIIYRNGGTRAIVDKITSWAKTRKKGEIAAGAVGTAIFFDDYSSMLVHGNAVRPMTDKLKTSRAKLAYIVDTTAAPIATAALVTTWIGFQVGLIDQAKAGLEGVTQGSYSIFLRSIPYLFYPIFAFLFMWTLLITGRDFGPIKKAQSKAAEGDLGGLKSSDGSEGGLTEKEGVPRRAFNALIPILVLLGATVAALFITGSGNNIREIIGSADSFSSLLWGSLLSVIAAVILSTAQRILSLGETVEAWLSGVKGILEVLVILTLAWAISAVTDQLHAANFLAEAIGGSLPPGVLPAIIFVLAAAIAFATGTSWGTMGILIPLTLPVTWGLISGSDLSAAAGNQVLYAAVGAVIGGAVWGDHASPISDTTVLSSATSQCGVVEHANTQLPYALSIGGVALVLSLLAGFRIPWIIIFIVGLAALGALVFFIAKVPKQPEESASNS